MTRTVTGLITSACAWLIAASLNAVIAQNTTDDERLFKAAFIYNFAKFTRWPKPILENSHNRFILCTSGSDQLVDDIRRLGGKMIKGRPVSIAALENGQAAGQCHLLYIAASKSESYSKTLEAVGDKPVLTISEIPDFGRNGGIIELYREQGQTRFIINLSRAKAADLDISSRLLNIAVVIGQEENP